jgi:hypothetical protein
MSASDVTPIVITRIRHEVIASDPESPASFTSDSCASSTSAIVSPAHGQGTSA